MSVLSIFFERRTDKEVKLPHFKPFQNIDSGKACSTVPSSYFWNESIILEHMSVTRSTGKMFMLPANEAKGSKHCFRFVRHVEEEQKICLH